MTRKDYVALAAAFAQAHADVESSTLLSDSTTKLDAHVGIDMVLDLVASTLAADNPRFDRGRFIADAAPGGRK